MTFADWLKEQIRRTPGMNQARLAEALGVYASTVHYWIKGRSEPDEENIVKLGELFGVEPNTIQRMLAPDLGEPYEFAELGTEKDFGAIYKKQK